MLKDAGKKNNSGGSGNGDEGYNGSRGNDDSSDLIPEFSKKASVKEIKEEVEMAQKQLDRLIKKKKNQKIWQLKIRIPIRNVLFQKRIL